MLCYATCTTIHPTSLLTADDTCSRIREQQPWPRGLRGLPKEANGRPQLHPRLPAMVVHQHEDKQPGTPMRLLESPKSEGFEPQVLDHIHALICSEIQQALGATSHHSPGADATSRSEESSSNQVPTMTSGSNPVPPNTVPIVSSSAGSVSSQLECHVCVRVYVCVCVCV